jgi:hypothetical protein
MVEAISPNDDCCNQLANSRLHSRSESLRFTFMFHSSKKLFRTDGTRVNFISKWSVLLVLTEQLAGIS